MKKILMLCLALVMGVGMCAAQKAADKKTVTTVFTTDIDCEHCVKKIMNNVPSLGKASAAPSSPRRVPNPPPAPRYPHSVPASE